MTQEQTNMILAYQAAKSARAALDAIPGMRLPEDIEPKYNELIEELRVLCSTIAKKAGL